MSEDPSKYSVAFASWWDEFSRQWRHAGNDYAMAIWVAKAAWDARAKDILPVIEVGAGIADLKKYINHTNVKAPEYA